MLDYTVCFFGHRELYDIRRVEEQLPPILTDLLRTKPYVTFLVGRNGEFDICVASVIKRVQKAVGHHNSELMLVLPYPVADIAYYQQYYDNVMIPERLCKARPKAAITLKNRWMAEQADLVIVNVERASGGAYTAMRYAEALAKEIINIGE